MCIRDQKRIASCDSVEATASFVRVNVHRHAEPAGLACDLSKQEILKRLVLGVRRRASARVSRIHATRDSRRCVVEVELAEIRRLELHGDACLLYTSDAADDLTRVDLGGRR